MLDLGGTPEFWTSAPIRPAHVTTVNLLDRPVDDSWQRHVVGDACDSRLDRFDLVVSNSLMEHVGGHAGRVRLAERIHESSDRYWVQTPYRYFPVEPHWMAPGMQWLPMPARVEVSRRWPIGNYRTRSPERRLEAVLEVELLTITEMRYYFPQSLIWKERLAGLPKSLVAIRPF